LGKAQLEMGGEIINIDLPVDDESIAIRPIKERNGMTPSSLLYPCEQKSAAEHQKTLS